MSKTSEIVDKLLATGRYSLGQAIAQAVQQEVLEESELDRKLGAA